MMAKIEKMLETQISLSEWLQRINHADAAALNREDNDKRERLDVLNKAIGLPFDKPTQFTAEELRDRVPRLKEYIKNHGDEKCALRLMPLSGEEHLPKLRMRGRTVSSAMEWFDEQDIDYPKYRGDFMPHTDDNQWATIFVVNQHGIFGEIYFGGHHILTQGFHEEVKPLTFAWDYKNWTIEPQNDDALAHLKGLVKMIHVSSEQTQNDLIKELDADFCHDYIKGYFETVSSSDMGVWYIDYNRVLGSYLDDVNISLNPLIEDGIVVSGRSASVGQGTGTVAIVSDPAKSDFKDGQVLVCKMTSPDYLPLMQRAAAIVTDEGGILCHAAIVARELGKPCVVSTGNATSKLTNGQTVSVNGATGSVTVVKQP